MKAQGNSWKKCEIQGKLELEGVEITVAVRLELGLVSCASAHGDGVSDFDARKSQLICYSSIN